MSKPLSSLATTAEKAVGARILYTLNVFDEAIQESVKKGTYTPDYKEFMHDLKASHVANIAKLSISKGKVESLDLLYTIEEEKQEELRKGAAANTGYVNFLNSAKEDIARREKASEIFSPVGHLALGKGAKEDLSRS